MSHRETYRTPGSFLRPRARHVLFFQIIVIFYMSITFEMSFTCSNPTRSPDDENTNGVKGSTRRTKLNKDDKQDSIKSLKENIKEGDLKS